MIRYTTNGRQYPRQLVHPQVVFRWASKGSGGAPPAGGGTHKRLFHNWLVYGLGHQNIFVWQNAGTTATPSGGGTHKRLFHNWLYYGQGHRNIFVWQNAGSSAVVPVTGAAVIPDAASSHRRRRYYARS